MGISAITEGALLVFIPILLSEIELWLKERVERLFRAEHGAGWWHSIPKRIRSSADWRYRWAVQQLGKNRVLAPAHTAWLSLGDTLSVLRSLTPDAWQRCLLAETRRKSGFEKSMERIKFFRDYHLAHPKPRDFTDHELRHLCQAILRVPEGLCPHQWRSVLSFLQNVRAMPEPSRSHFREVVLHWPRPDRQRLRRWLRCPDLEEAGVCTHADRLPGDSITWRAQVLQWCALFDTGGQIFLGRVD